MKLPILSATQFWPHATRSSCTVLLLSALAGGPIAANSAGVFLSDAKGCQVWDSNPHQGESVTWSGHCKDGKADGEGRVEWIVDGKTISSAEGPFRDGRLNGHGVINYSNGTRFEGTVVDGVPEAEKFALKQQSTGSHIARGAVTNLVIPPDKSYAELSPQQQAMLKGQYESMQAADEPPYPAFGSHTIYDAIHRVQQNLMVEGKLDMVVQVNEQGKATSVAVLSSPDPKMTQAAASILMLQQYKPAVCGGAPCAMAYPFRVDFTTAH